MYMHIQCGGGGGRAHHSHEVHLGHFFGAVVVVLPPARPDFAQIHGVLDPHVVVGVLW